MNLKNIREISQKVLKTPEYFGLIMIFFALVGYLLSPATPKNLDEPRGPIRIDSMIPAGMRLVPVTIVNPAALHALLDDYGLVDLYSGNRRIGTSVKILRNSENQELFSVLIPEDSVELFLQYNTALNAVVRNQSHTGTRIEKLGPGKVSPTAVVIKHLIGEEP